MRDWVQGSSWENVSCYLGNNSGCIAPSYTPVDPPKYPPDPVSGAVARWRMCVRELCKHHQVTLTPHGRGRARTGFVAYDHLLGGGIADTASGDGATPQLSAPPPVHLHPDTLEPMLEPREATDDAHDPTEDERSPILAGGPAPALPRPRGRRRAWRTCLHPDTLQPLEDEPSPRSSPTPATPRGELTPRTRRRGQVSRSVHSANAASLSKLRLPAVSCCPAQSKAVVCKASPSHMVLAGHACILATAQCTRRGCFRDFRTRAEQNAGAVTPVGAWLLRSCQKDSLL